MAADQKIHTSAANLKSNLELRLASTTYPMPVARAYDASGDLYLTVTADANGPDAIIKFEKNAALACAATNMFGIAQTVFTPHIVKLLLEGGTKARATATIVTAVGGVQASATATIVTAVGGVQAFGTATVVSVVAGNKVTINGHDFVASAGAPVGDQFQVDASDTNVATNLENAINSSVTVGIAGLFTATSNLNVVTITAVTWTAATGNAYAFAKTGAPITITGAGTLTGGVDGNAVVINGVTFLCTAAASTLANSWVKGADDTGSAAHLADAITASASGSIAGIVTASPNLGVVTVKAVSFTAATGNALTFTKVGAPITVTGGGTLAGGIDGSAVVINGVTFLCTATTATLANSWVVGLNDTGSATNLAAAINASASAGVSGIVTASPNIGVVTVKAVDAGLDGNYITFTKMGAPITVTGGGFLAGGADNNTNMKIVVPILAECARMGSELKVYVNNGIAVGDLVDDTYLISDFQDLNGLMAGV